MQAFFNTVCNLRQLLKPCLGTCFRSKGLPHQGRWVVECRQTSRFHHNYFTINIKFSSSFPFLLFRHTLSTWQNNKEKMTDGSRVTDKDSKASEEEINSSHEKGSKWRLWPFFLLHLSSGLSGTSCPSQLGKLPKSENYISVHWKHCQLSTCLLAITGTKYFFFSS